MTADRPTALVALGFLLCAALALFYFLHEKRNKDNS